MIKRVSISSRMCVLATIAVTAGGAGARADIVTLVSVADNTLYQGSNSRSNGAGDHIFAGRTEENRLRRALVRFDVSSIPPGSTVTGITCTLHLSRTRAGAASVSLHKVLASWGEAASNASEEEGEGAQARPGDATWSHRFYDTMLWATPGGDFMASPSSTIIVGAESGFYSWSSDGAIADVQSWVNNGSSNYGWILLGDESASMTAKRFDSRENSNPSSRPMLMVAFDPPADCEADFNVDGAVNSQDFFDFLGAFFATDPLADFNADGTVNSQDFFDFLAAFFAGC